MSEQEDNERLLLAAFDAYNRRELEKLGTILDENIEAHIARPLVNAGTWQGLEGFREMLDNWTDAFASQTNHVTAMHHPDANHVIAEVHQVGVGAGSGVEVEMDAAYLLEIRDGRVVRLHMYPDLEQAWTAVRE